MLIQNVHSDVSVNVTWFGVALSRSIDTAYSTSATPADGRANDDNVAMSISAIALAKRVTFIVIEYAVFYNCV